jgi:hypothetical protein
MPRGFTKKDERQVLAIKKSCRSRGGSKADCDRIAFSTVNKRRRAEGRSLGDSDALAQGQMLMLDDLDVFGLDQRQQNKLSVVGMVGSLGTAIAIIPGMALSGGARSPAEAMFEKVVGIGLPVTFGASALLHSNRFVNALVLLPVAMFVVPQIHKARARARTEAMEALRLRWKVIRTRSGSLMRSDDNVRKNGKELFDLLVSRPETSSKWRVTILNKDGKIVVRKDGLPSRDEARLYAEDFIFRRRAFA